MRALIFGAGGMLGQELVQHLPGAGYDLVGAPRGRADGDIADRVLVEATLDRLAPEVVFNSAAWTDVDGAEDHPEEARRANAEGPQVLAAACAARGLRLVHYSTDFVFDGERETPYDESIPANPQSVYARTKLEGERLAAAANPRSFVVRIGCLYGQGGRNFPSTVLRRLRAGELIRADNERRVAPTWVRAVAEVSGRLAATEHFGLYHAMARGETCWADFARFVAEAANLPQARVEAVAGSALKLKAQRPRRSVMVSARLPEIGIEPPPTWQEQVRNFIATQ